MATVAGKKFYLLNLNEEERAIKAIAELLKLGDLNNQTPSDNKEMDAGKGKKKPLPFEPEDTEEPSEAPAPTGPAI